MIFSSEPSPSVLQPLIQRVLRKFCTFASIRSHLVEIGLLSHLHTLTERNSSAASSELPRNQKLHAQILRIVQILRPWLPPLPRFIQERTYFFIFQFFLLILLLLCLLLSITPNMWIYDFYILYKHSIFINKIFFITLVKCVISLAMQELICWDVIKNDFMFKLS